MSSYHINLDDDVLKVGFSTNVTTGDEIVRDAAARLNQMIATGELPGGSLIKINGRISVLVSQVLADKLSKLYDAIALFDPKIGDKGLDRYVITISNTPEYQVGDTLDLVRTEQKPGIKVVLCGFPNTGKTCLRDGLKQALLQIPHGPASYFISGCPDGDGSWYGETARRDPDLAKQLKAEYKARFTPEFAQKKAQEIKGVNTPIFVFDVGGKISQDNRLIMAHATHAVILVKDENDVAPWEELCHSLGLRVMAIIYSDYHGVEDVIASEIPVLKGIVHRLQRGEDVYERPMIQALARILVRVYSSYGK